MDLTGEREALREAVRGLLAKYPPEPDSSRYDPALWARLCGEIGVAGLAVPECYGGSGAGLRETGVVLAELGRALCPSPLLGSAVLAARALLASGDRDACRRLLPGIADGTRIAALAWTGPAGRWAPDDVACVADPDGLVSGEAHYVLDGDLAEVLLVAAATAGGTGLYEVDPAAPGVAVTAVTAVDLTRRLAVVALDRVPGRRVGGDATAPLATARDAALAGLAAEQAGAAARALDVTVGYAKVRHQFGRPIGAFQALQHRMADLHVLVETAYSVADAAAADPALVAAAGVYCAEAFTRVAGEMIQLHGGIGITWEHDAHRFFKRAHGGYHLFGSPAAHVDRLAAELLDGRR